jgi:hypothetical protein
MMDKVTEPARRAALLLHSLAPADRDWVLGRLPEPARATLSGLLRELGELGIPADPALLAAVADSGQGGTARVHAVNDGDASVLRLCRVVAGFDPHALAALFREEPAILTASFLRLFDWPWREQFLQSLGPLRARHVAELLSATAQDTVPPRERPVHRYLLGRLVERFGHDELGAARERLETAAPAHARGWLSRFLVSRPSRRAA